MSKMSYFGGLRSLWGSKYGFFIVEGGWSSDRYEGGLNLFYAPEIDLGPRWTQTPEKDHLKTYFDVFLSFMGFILPQTDQKCTFYTIFSSKLPSGRYEASSNWIFAPRSILSPRMSSDPKERRSGHKIHLISSFLGFILPKSDQKCTF